MLQLIFAGPTENFSPQFPFIDFGFRNELLIYIELDVCKRIDQDSLFRIFHREGVLHRVPVLKKNVGSDRVSQTDSYAESELPSSTPVPI